jgi:hypothetical protein
VAYLFGAVDNGRLPDDRSFTYSLLIRGLVRPFDSLWALVWWQTFAGVATAAIAWQVMVTYLAVPRRIALVGACILAIEPAQLYYERMVLAEAFGLLAFALFTASACAYVARPHVLWLAASVVAGLAAATLRHNYLTVVVAISIGTPLVPLVDGHRREWMRVAAHTAAATALVVATHGVFQYWVSLIFNSPPGYIARTGFMQLGLVMPLVRPEHLARVGLPPDFADQLRFPMDDPDARMSHQWASGGFVRTLRDRRIPIEPVARPLARMALADDPVGLVRLGVHTVGNYFREEGIRHARDNDLGRRVIPYEVLWTLREIWHYDASGLWQRRTAVSRYFEIGTWWLVCCLFVLVPLGLAAIAKRWRTPQRGPAVLVGLIAIGLVAAHVLFVPVAFYRYLHPLPLFVVVCACMVVGATRVPLRRHLHRH